MARATQQSFQVIPLHCSMPLDGPRAQRLPAAVARSIASRAPEISMASLTKTTKYKRKLRKKRAGRAAKNYRAIHGTTPKFAVRSADALANAPIEQLTTAEAAARG
ncbi:MAG: hypothetical protein ACI9MC_004205 [Kiritimatiellia bacterium]|jgi:hypothetical protein